MAPGYEGEHPSPQQLQEFCNLGYAEGCTRLPRERPWDSIRFGARTVSIAAAENGGKQRIHIRYVCERAHLPAGHGVLEFNPAQGQWLTQHVDIRIQRMAECFLASYLDARKNREATGAAAS
jgi:hypothetical protein